MGRSKGRVINADYRSARPMHQGTGWTAKQTWEGAVLEHTGRCVLLLQTEFGFSLHCPLNDVTLCRFGSVSGRDMGHVSH